MSASHNHLLLALALTVAAGSAGLVAWKLWPARHEEAPRPSFTVAPAPEANTQPGHVSTIIDLPGDPVVLQRATLSAPRELHFALPVSLAPTAPKTDALGYFIGAPLVSTTGGYMSKYVESGGEANALSFQLAYNAAQLQGSADTANVGADDDGGDETPANAQAQWLTLDNSNQLEVAPPDRPAMHEALIKTVVAEKIADVLVADGFSPDSAKAIEAATKDAYNVQSLPPGSAALAYGALDASGAYRVDLLAIWEDREYVGAVGLLENGQYGVAARPRAPEDLLRESPTTLAPARFVLADGLYSAGLRSGAPEGVVREAIQLLGRLTDLKAPLPADETLRLLYTRDVRTKGKAGGRIVYVGLGGSAGPFDCYAFEAGNGAYACYDPKAAAAPSLPAKLGNSGATATGGILAPIKGAPITSLYGTRFHPILHILRLHAGIDFGAAIGSQVRAAADGKIEIAGPVQGFGNHIRVQHDGFETSYSHLSEIPEGMKPGVAVKQGDIIALSGNTGLSTGPHLHFEYYENREAVDPLPHLGAEAQASAAALGGGAPVVAAGPARPSDAEAATFPAFKTAVDAVLAAAAR